VLGLVVVGVSVPPGDTRLAGLRAVHLALGRAGGPEQIFGPGVPI